MNPFCESTSLDKMLTLLQYLGIQTLGDLLKIPKDQLTSRMGREVVLARHYIDAANVLPWPRFYLQEKIIERFEVADLCAIQNLEPMLFALKQILDRVTLRLRGRGQLIVSFQLRVFQDRYSTTKKYKRSWDFALSFPVHSTRDLLTILRERLSSSLQREPLDSAIRELEFEVVQAVAFAGRQTHFFSKKEEELEGFQSIVARLAERLGSGRVFMAKPIESYVAERCWQKSEVGFVDLESVGLRMSAKPVAEAAPGHAAVHAHGRATGYAYAPVPIRPLRILRNPQILRKIENQMIHPSRRWQIVRWLGPERISGEWWLGDQERDYFRALTDTGEELWIFKNTENIDSEYYLHGIFD